MSATVDLGIGGLEVRSGDHICAFYRGAERDDVLVPFLEPGLRERLQRRQLELVDFDSSYLASGQFVPDQMLEFWDHNVGSALQGGDYRFVRAAGEMTWALGDLPGVDQLVAYESELNRFLPRYSQVILCLYNIERFSGALLLDMLKTHPKVLLGGTVFDNP